jgi:hypothetical protein
LRPAAARDGRETRGASAVAQPIAIVAICERKAERGPVASITTLNGEPRNSVTVTTWRVRFGGLQDSLAHLTAAVQRIEHCDAIRIADHRLAIQGERLRQHLRGRGCDRRITLGPVIAIACEQSHRRAVAADDQPVAVVLDLMHPAQPYRRVGGTDRSARVDEPIGAEVAGEHAHLGNSPARQAPVESSQCRGAAWDGFSRSLYVWQMLCALTLGMAGGYAVHSMLTVMGWH